MRLTYVEARNFGVIEHFRQDYVDGMIVVRGSNGAGKTTMTLQAPLYAFFGASTLEATLEETVRRGEKPNSMKVVAGYGPYTVSRSKASASVTGNGIEISGQAEVSDFFYQLFGIQKGAEEAVLVSYQGEAAGIVRKKPAEVTTTIEALAGFYQIDELIERLKVKFPSGSKAILEENIEEAKAKVAALNSTELPLIAPFRHTVATTKISLEEAIEDVAVREKAKTAADKSLSKAKDHNHKVVLAKNDLTQKESVLKTIADRIYYLNTTSYETFNEVEIEKARTDLATVESRRKTWELYTWCLGLVDLAVVWEGDIASFETELITTAKHVKESTKLITTIEADIKSKKASVITDKNCTLCGQAVEHLHVKLNKKILKEVEALETHLTIERELLEESQETLVILNQINNEQLRREKKDQSYFNVDKGVVPYRFEWAGEVPTQPEEGEVVKLSQLVSDYNSTKALIAKDKKELAQQQLKHAEQSRLVNETRLANVEVEILLGPLNEAVENALKVLKCASANKEAAQEALNSAEKELMMAEQTVKHHKENLQSTETIIAELKEKLRKDGRNSKMLKAVREAKVKVLNQIWTRILCSVSQTYSDMMGREMIVDKSLKGFQVNNGPVSRLSGAEKSTLGIAMRDALRNVFAPGCSFIFFDEPFADLDEVVKANTIAGLYNLRGQRFIITHENDTEVMADQVVEYAR